MKKILFSMFACVCALMVLCGCDSPKKGFEEWRDAVADGKADKAMERVTKNMKELTGLLAASCKDEKEEAQKIRNMGVISVEENGDKATLKYTNQDGKIEEAQMVKEDGKWKIDR